MVPVRRVCLQLCDRESMLRIVRRYGGNIKLIAEGFGVSRCTVRLAMRRVVPDVYEKLKAEGKIRSSTRKGT